jgi:hypothetical protein
MLFCRRVHARGGDGEAGAPDDGKSTAEPEDPEATGSTENLDVSAADPGTPGVAGEESCMSGASSAEDPRVATSVSTAGGRKPPEAATSSLSDSSTGPRRPVAASYGGGFDVDAST